MLSSAPPPPPKPWPITPYYLIDAPHPHSYFCLPSYRLQSAKARRPVDIHEPAQITPNGVQVYHCVRSHQCIAYCPLLTVCYLCYNWRPHCWAATAVHHCTRLFVTSLQGYDHPPLCSTSFTNRQASPARSLHYYRTPYDLGSRCATVPGMPQLACTMATAMKKNHS